MKTIKTHLPGFHAAPLVSMMSWAIDHDVIHIAFEEPFGIEGMDFKMSVGLTEDGMPSTHPDDILEAIAFSIESGHEYLVDEITAIHFIETLVLPHINENFPRP